MQSADEIYRWAKDNGGVIVFATPPGEILKEIRRVPAGAVVHLPKLVPRRRMLKP